MRRVAIVVVLAFSLLTSVGWAQTPPAQSGGSATSQPQPELAADPLGRTTPRGTVLGFLNAARKGEIELAREYLNTTQSGEAGHTLAHQLFVVLDARLPAKLAQISEAPEGSGSNPLEPDQEVVGMIVSRAGAVEVVLERVSRRNAAPIWLFSRRTLDSVPALYQEITASQSYRGVFGPLARSRPGGVLLIEWLLGLAGLIAFYIATVLLNRILSPLASRLWGAASTRGKPRRRNILPMPARLLIVALAGRWVLSSLSLSLLVRQFWSDAASLLTIGAVVWLLILLNGEVEQYIHRFLPRSNTAAAGQLLRLLRRTADTLAIFAGLLVTLRLFSVDPTPALAGLGVGGIAVALAAQKTLENVVAGASLIFDQAVRVGDYLKMGNVEGTVDHIGLRSTRIRTLDRTVVSVPNAQIASASLETVSARDKFWFHPVVGLRYETTSDQLRAVVDGIRRLLESHPSIDPGSVRVRFVRLGAFSLDVDVFAYLHARDWNHFLELQEQLLFSITEIVSDAGTGIAFPSQTMYMANAQLAEPVSSRAVERT
jgi:MscS family membrane protein